MPARCGRWGHFLERRAQQLQRQVQAKEERIVELETENAVLHLKVAEYEGRTGTGSGQATRLCHEQALPQGTRSPLLRLHHAAQELKQDIKELHSSSVELFRNCQEQPQDCLSEIVTAIERAQLQQETLPSWRSRALHLERSLQEVKAQYHLERQRRKWLHNSLVELKGNVRVHCRIRPVLPFDDESDDPVSHNSPVSAEVAHAVDDKTTPGGNEHCPLFVVSLAVTRSNLTPLCVKETVLVRCSRPGHPSINKTFNFERVYGPAEAQTVVFGDVRPLLTSLLDGDPPRRDFRLQEAVQTLTAGEDRSVSAQQGLLTASASKWEVYNVCIMVSGQTGSGKSHTMLGPRPQERPLPPSEPHGDAGVMPRAAEELFRLISENPSRSAKVEVSIVEVYNNNIFDLLAKDSCTVMSGVKRQVLTTKEGKKEVAQLTSVPVHSARECMALVGAALQLRARHATLVHAGSSRSHLIITVTLTTAPSCDSTAEQGSDPSPLRELDCPWPQQSATGRRRSASHGASSGSPGAPPGSTAGHAGQVCAKLQLVDLAGSECAGVSGVTGPALRETSFINRSLAALADVLGALSERRGHVPYRSSKLTHVLQDALGGDAKLLVILCVSPCQRHVAETLQSLGFGQRARQVQRGCHTRRKAR